MGPPTVTMRCPSCGRELRAVLAPAPPTQWFPCPSCHVPFPVVVPRDLPPLYSWEVIPGLYPQLVQPRRPRWRAAPIASVALAVAAALAAVTVGVLGFDGYVASEPARYVVSGTAYEQLSGGRLVPAAGARVVLTSDSGRTFGTETTGPSGTFSFDGVPDGGIEINVTAPGYAPTVVYTFASRSYSAQLQGLDVMLQPGGLNNSSADVLTPFGNLEELLSYVGGGAVLLGGAAVVAAVGSVATRRPDGAVLGVLGGAAAVAVPATLIFLALGNVFSAATIVAGAAGGAGAFALVFTTMLLASSGSGTATG